VEIDAFKQVSLKRKKEREREILGETYYRGRSLANSCSVWTPGSVRARDGVADNIVSHCVLECLRGDL